MFISLLITGFAIFVVLNVLPYFKGVGAWIDRRLPIFSFLLDHLSYYPAPKNLNIWYAFGALAMVACAIQFISGIWLVMYYTPTAEQAFSSVQLIMREVPYGWLVRYVHSTGVSLWFVVVYFHIFRGLMYGSYKTPRELLWMSGVVLLFLLMAEAYTGYVLPWGQMSFWASKVIISLFSSIPVVGNDIVVWLQGDYEVSGVTLHRFFAFHVVGFSFLILAMIFLHIIMLHSVGSNNPDGVDIMKHKDRNGWPLDAVPYYPYFVMKYIPIILLYLFVFFVIVFYAPTFFGLFLEAENFERANPLVTPLHIKPSWYLSPYYAILRSIPDKSLGALMMLMSIVLWLFLPWLDLSPVRSMRYRGWMSRTALITVVGSFVLLGYLGLQPAVGWYLVMSRVATLLYFSFFLLIPILSYYDQDYVVPDRIPER
ncbi:MAG: cytochrome b [Legionellales bacterium]|nr:cytochrome b [Legionellales bacterium]HAV93820.1 cytochrome b [Pseudomonadota bacterium]